MANKIILVCGPSGSGKGTALKPILEGSNPPETTVSYTTRSMRRGEVDGKDYHFVWKLIFWIMRLVGKFVESATIHGNFYGTTKKELEKKLSLNDVLFDIDYQGAMQIKAKYPQAITILVLPPTLAELPGRLRARGESEESIARRMETAKEELKHAQWFDYWIVNRDQEVFIQEFGELVNDLREYGTTSVIYQDKEKLKKHIAAMM